MSSPLAPVRMAVAPMSAVRVPGLSTPMTTWKQTAPSGVMYRTLLICSTVPVGWLMEAGMDTRAVWPT